MTDVVLELGQQAGDATRVGHVCSGGVDARTSGSGRKLMGRKAKKRKEKKGNKRKEIKNGKDT